MLRNDVLRLSERFTALAEMAFAKIGQNIRPVKAGRRKGLLDVGATRMQGSDGFGMSHGSRPLFGQGIDGRRTA